MNALEIVGVVITLLSIWLMIREHVLGWVMAIVSCLIYAIIYWNAQLYSNAELQFIYIAISVYGFILWHKGINPKLLPVTIMGNDKFLVCILVVLLLGITSGYVHSTFTNAQSSYLDAMLTSTCIVAQWMMARKYLQCWYLWIIANIGYILLYLQSSLWSTLILYTVILFLNIQGFSLWKNQVSSRLFKSIHT